MYKKYINSGMSRKAYSLGKGRCLKTFIEGREIAGKWQNRNEAQNLILAYKNNLICFPKLLSYNDDYSEIIVEECKTLNKFEIDNILKPLLNSADVNSFNNLKYPNINDLSALAFGLDSLIDDYLSSNSGNLNIENLKKLCIYLSSSDKKYKKYFFEIPQSWIGKVTLSILSLEQLRSIADLIEFKILFPEKIIIGDLWNHTQWGLLNGQLVIIDAGFDELIQKSKHYHGITITPLDKVCEVTYPGQNSLRFNGEDLENIVSPNGNSVQYKFFTSKDSEYVLASDGMAERIKKAGLQDDGLHSWTDKTIFTSYDTLLEVMKTIDNNIRTLQPAKVDFNNDSLVISSLNTHGEWESSFQTRDFSLKPIIGKHVLEFKFDGNNIISKFHPGHDVSYIEYSKEI